MSKQGLGAGIIVALALVLAIGSYVTYQKHSALNGNNQNNPDSSLTTFSSADLDLSFTYPKNYQLTESDDEEGAVKIVTLIDKANLPVGQNTEGPPAINVQVFQNPRQSYSR
jgi:hypothetical protein